MLFGVLLLNQDSWLLTFIQAWAVWCFAAGPKQLTSYLRKSLILFGVLLLNQDSWLLTFRQAWAVWCFAAGPKQLTSYLRTSLCCLVFCCWTKTADFLPSDKLGLFGVLLLDQNSWLLTFGQAYAVWCFATEPRQLTSYLQTSLGCLVFCCWTKTADFLPSDKLMLFGVLLLNQDSWLLTFRQAWAVWCFAAGPKQLTSYLRTSLCCLVFCCCTKTADFLTSDKLGLFGVLLLYQNSWLLTFGQAWAVWCFAAGPKPPTS